MITSGRFRGASRGRKRRFRSRSKECGSAYCSGSCAVLLDQYPVDYHSQTAIVDPVWLANQAPELAFLEKTSRTRHHSRGSPYMVVVVFLCFLSLRDHSLRCGRQTLTRGHCYLHLTPPPLHRSRRPCNTLVAHRPNLMGLHGSTHRRCAHLSFLLELVVRKRFVSSTMIRLFELMEVVQDSSAAAVGT